MLRVATKRVAACTVQVTLPSEVRYGTSYRNYCFYRFVGDESTDEVRDLGSAPKTGEADALGNRPVVHSNVKGTVTYGTSLRLRIGEPGTGQVLMNIPQAHITDNSLVDSYYNAILPQCVHGSLTMTPRYNSQFAYCRIQCDIGGSLDAINITVRVMLGPYTDKRTGKVYPSESAYASVVLTPSLLYSRTFHLCGRKGDKYSKVEVLAQAIFPNIDKVTSTAYAGILISGFQPAIWQVQLVHTLLAARRITSGDTKAISDAFESIRLASFNGLAFTRDTSRLVRDTSRLIRDIKRVRHDPSRIASIWLSYRYGHRLYYQDCKKLHRALSSIRRAKPLKFRGRHVEYLSLLPGSTTRVEYNIILYCSAFCFDDLSLESQIRSLDFWPSAENLWDLLPYTFVADWFINVTDICKRYDMRQDILRYPIVGAVQSVKCTTQSTVSSPSGSGNAEITYYVRLPLTPAQLSTTLLTMNLSLMSGISLLHLADALALGVSHRGR